MFLLSLGTRTLIIAPGLAVAGSKEIRFTKRSACKVLNLFAVSGECCPAMKYFLAPLPFFIIGRFSFFQFENKILKYITMAEGGEERDPLLEEHTDDKDSDDEEGTFHFPRPVSSSTPHNPSEDIEMRTRLHENSGLPDTSYSETNFGGTPSTEEIEKRLNFLRNSRMGLLNTSKIELQNIILSEEDKQKEIKRSQSFYQTSLPPTRRS